MAGLKPEKGQSLTHALLARAHSPDSTQRIYAEKIQHRPLLLRPSSPPPTTATGTGHDARAARRVSRRSQERKQRDKRRAAGLRPEPLSARQRRRMGLYDVASDRQQKFSIFEPLHGLWLGYVREILGSELHTGGQGAAAKLASADMHGALVRVSRSSCPSRVGIEGIVVRDSRFAFQIVTRANAIKLVPKEGTMFRVDVPASDLSPAPAGAKIGKGSGGSSSSSSSGKEDADAGRRNVFTFEVLGDQFQTRSADRANRKFRNHFLEHL